MTLGIPRLREIVMTASTKPKTPSMTMVVSDGVSTQAVETFCKKASRLTLSQIVDTVVVKERLAVNGSNRSKEFTIDMTFFPREEYRSEYDVDSPEILAAFGTRFPLILKKEIQDELKKLDADLKNQIAALGKGKAVKATAEGDGGDEEGDDAGEGEAIATRGGDDDVSEVGDGDAEDAKRAKQKKEQATYESDDEDTDLDDAAIEAKFSPDGNESGVEGGGDAVPDATNEKSRNQMENVFQTNFSAAKSFKFNHKRCKIELSVCSKS